MLHVSELLLQHRDISTFAELIGVVKERAKTEMFFRMDLKPPYPDTPDNWEMILEAAFSSANESPAPVAAAQPSNTVTGKQDKNND